MNLSYCVPHTVILHSGVGLRIAGNGCYGSATLLYVAYQHNTIAHVLNDFTVA